MLANADSYAYARAPRRIGGHRFQVEETQEARVYGLGVHALSGCRREARTHGAPQLLPLRTLQENFEAIFRDRTLPEDPSFYAVVPSKTEPRGPEGMESLFVLVPVPHLGPNVDWDRDGDAFREKVYGLLERRCGLERSVVYEKTRTPLDWRDEYNLEEGPRSESGTASSGRYFRPPMVSRAVQGMYFVGASTRPGTGVPLVTIGAKLVADRIGREVGGA